MAVLTAMIGLIGVILGSLIVALYQDRQSKMSVYERLLAFYEYRINLLETKEHSMISKWEEPPLEVERAKIRADLLIKGSQEVVEAEESFFSAMWSREMDFIYKREEYKRTGKQVFDYVGLGPHESSAKSMAILKKSHEVFDKRHIELINALRNDSGLWKQIKSLFIKYNIKLPNRYSTLSATSEALSLIEKDVHCVENLYRGRIADMKQREGAEPFDLAVFTQTLSRSGLDDNILGITYEPSVSIRQDQIDSYNVSWALGYDFIHFLDEKRMLDDLSSIRKYYERQPDGTVTILKKEGSEWKEEISADAVNCNKAIDYIIEFGNKIFNDYGKTKDDELNGWKKLLKNSGIIIPEWNTRRLDKKL